MGDSVSMVFTIILAVIVMFLFPLMDTWERQDDLSYMAVYTATVDFVDAVRNTGVLTKSMYESYLSQIGGTANTYDVTLEHREYLVVPSGDSTEVIYLNHYFSEIEDKLYDATERYSYPFTKGDYFYVSVKNTNKTQATMMEQTAFGTRVETFKIGVPYGGQIKTTYHVPVETE